MTDIDKDGNVMEIYYVECDCYSEEHTLRFIIDDDKEYPALHTITFMQTGTFFARLWNAIRYICGRKCRYGHFNCFTTDEPMKLRRLADLCNRVAVMCEKAEEERKL